MLKCSNFRRSFDLSLCFNRQQRSKTLSLHLMQKHGKQAFLNYTAYQTTCCRYAHMETEPWVLTKILSSFLLAEGLHMSGETEWKRFHFGWYVSSYPTYFLQICQLEFCLKFQWFALNMLHNLKADLNVRFYSKETAILSPAVALKFFPLLSLHCWGSAKMFSILCTRSFVKLMLSELLVAILWFCWQ